MITKSGTNDKDRPTILGFASQPSVAAIVEVLAGRVAHHRLDILQADAVEPHKAAQLDADVGGVTWQPKRRSLPPHEGGRRRPVSSAPQTATNGS